MENLYKTSIVQGSEQSQTTVFNDGSAQWHVAFPSGEDETRGVALSDNLSLREFFERPIYAANFSWDPSSPTPFYQAINPWQVFFSNIRVSNRISNYNLLHCKLRVKLMISGNSFYYGRLLAHYDPLSAYNKVSQFGSGGGTVRCVQASQGLSAFIDPTESQGCEFTLPFIWFDDTASIPQGDIANLGMLYIRQLQFLKHANASTDPINISMFLWAEDVKVSVPTTANAAFISAQSGGYDDTGVYAQGDEYGTGAVSALAGTIAAKAGRLATVPYIGKYMRATEMASGAMAGIAKLFGFSRPVCLDEITYMKPVMAGQLALTNVTDMSTKLTVDAKQELTIDPSVIGIGAPDELSLVHLASQQSYLTQFPWAVSRVAGDLLWEARVNPVIYDLVSPFYYLPACAYAALPFTHWRGTMRYRFQIVASGFHKGRLAIAWDPYSMDGTIQSNIVHTRIIDLANERDVIIDIPWGSNHHYLNTLALSGVLSFKTTAGHYPANPLSCNGAISITVLNELSSPSALVNNDIAINVFVSMCEDAEFAVPNDRIGTITVSPTIALKAQAGEYDDTGNNPEPEAATEILDTCLPSDDASNLVYFGEKITSFRQLLKRFVYHAAYLSPSTLEGEVIIYTPDFPNFLGWYSGGVEITGADTRNFGQTTMINYLALAFIGYRGGIRRKYMYNSTVASPPGYMSVSRDTNAGGAIVHERYFLPYNTTSSYAFANAKSNIRRGLTGSALTSITQSPILEVELPYYSTTRFSNGRWTSGYSPVASLAQMRHALQWKQPAGTHYIDTWVAAAEDFTVIGFQGCPPIATSVS